MTDIDDQCFYIESCHLTGAGYGLDIGGSLAKLAYITKDTKGSSEKLCVCTKHFDKDNLDEVVEFIRRHSDLGTPESTVNVTGFGCHTNRGKLEKALNVKLNVVIEFDCFARALHLLIGHLPLSQVLYPPSDEAQRVAIEAMKAWASVRISLGAENTDQGSDSSTNNNEVPIDLNWCYISEEEWSRDHFPCLVAMLGSGVGHYIVTGSKEHYLVGGSGFGGKTLTGLSKLLTGTKNFDELMELAARGRNTGVDICGCHMKSSVTDANGSTNFYSAFPDQETVYYFGQLNDSEGPFKKEDLATSLVNSFCYDVVCMVQTTAQLHKLNRIFFAGSMPQHPHFRQILEKLMLQRSVIMDAGKKDCKFGFLQNGGQLGALGTLLL